MQRMLDNPVSKEEIEKKWRHREKNPNIHEEERDFIILEVQNND